MTADTKEEISLVLGTSSDLLYFLTLGILTLFAEGKFPTTDKTAATWVQGDMPSSNRGALV